MTRAFRPSIPVLMLLVAACASKPSPPPPLDAPVEVDRAETLPEWRRIARGDDADRIDDIARAWDEAIARTGERRYAAASRDAGDLVDPSAALPRPAPPPGPYFCRTLKLGLPDRAGYAAYRPFNCYVDAEGDVLTLVKQSGSERPAGRLYFDDDPGRLVFLGGMALDREEAPPAYGDNPLRNVAGIVERVGPFRYRLVVPWPRGDSVLDLIELVPLVENVPTP